MGHTNCVDCGRKMTKVGKRMFKCVNRVCGSYQVEKHIPAKRYTKVTV